MEVVAVPRSELGVPVLAHSRLLGNRFPIDDNNDTGQHVAQVGRDEERKRRRQE